jgi:hypothetical protein
MSIFFLKIRIYSYFAKRLKIFLDLFPPIAEDATMANRSVKQETNLSGKIPTSVSPTSHGITAGIIL